MQSPESAPGSPPPPLGAATSLAIARGILIGAAAGTLSALGDFGASWLWMPGLADKAALLLRMLATLLPLGAILGAVGGIVANVGDRIAVAIAGWLARGRPERARRLGRWLQPMPALTALAPAIVWVALQLFTGGQMSRLDGLPLWQTLAVLVLLTASYGTLALARRYVDWAITTLHARTALASAGVLLMVAFLCGKADQTFYPGFYGYLHATLAAVGGMVYALGVTVVAIRWRKLTRMARRARTLSAAVTAVALAAAAAHVITLDRNQNVRVALFDPRAATTRSAMLAIMPLLPSSDVGSADSRAAQRARRARRERLAVGRDPTWPTTPDAHVLLVTIDAQRADHLGVYGYGRPVSPELDTFAAGAVVFERAYAQAPHSSYSLCSLMTGQYLHELVDLELPLPAETLAKHVTELGYHSAAFFTLGIFHTEGELLVQYQDDAFGFRFHDHRDLRAEPKTDRALEEVDRIVERGEPPSFLWVHYFDVHEPYHDTSLGTSPMDRYDGEIRNVDRALARLLREVDTRFQRPVIVAISADHGEEFRDHGGVYHGSTLYEEQVRVPLIVRAPGFPARRVPEPVELVDLSATLLLLIGSVPSPGMGGDDLRPAMLGRTAALSPAFSAVGHRRMVLRWPHKLIANLAMGLFEVYDLDQDPRERVNLANDEPALRADLTGELYAWLDSMRSGDDAGIETSPEATALDRGRLGDRRAVPALADLVADPHRDIAHRREAAQLLGSLAAAEAGAALVRAVGDEDRTLAAEAAIALGRLGRHEAEPMLIGLSHAEDPSLRARAAIALAHLGNGEAVPGLIDAIWVGNDKEEREDAVYWLGRLRDRRAVEPLLAILPEFRLRYLTVVALGEIGDLRAYQPLLDMLTWETHTNVRDNVARALGQLGNRDATPRLLDLLHAEPNLKNTSEALVRLGAIETGLVGGTDVGPSVAGRYLHKCREQTPMHREYTGRTRCETVDQHTVLRLRAPIVGPVRAGRRRARRGFVALLRIRRADAEDAAPIDLTLSDRSGRRLTDTPMTTEVDGSWTEWRVPIPEAGAPPAAASIDTETASARFEIDHLLIAPLP